MKNFFPFPTFREIKLLCCLLLLFTSNLFAQTAFITAYPPNQIGLPSIVVTRYNAFSSDVRNQTTKIVSTADVRSKQVNGKLSFLLPGLTDSLHVEATMIRDDTSGFTWAGKILNKPGYVSFIKLNGLTSGFIQVGNQFYELLPVNTSYQCLVERKSEDDKGCGTPGLVVSPPSSGPDRCTKNGNLYNTCPSLTYILLVITPAAKTYILNNYLSIDNYVRQGQELINQAFLNSDIPNKEVAIKWIEKNISSTTGLDNPVTEESIDIDRLGLPTLLEPERTNNKADVAFLVTDQNYPNAAGATTDIGIDKTTAYGILEVDYMISSYTIAHELGHLFDCHHNWAFNFGNDDEAICAHGYRWTSPLGIPNDGVYEVDSWGTLVSIGVNPYIIIEIDPPFGSTYKVHYTSNTRILHYSNPDIYYESALTGVASGHIADNAYQIRNAACEVSDFFASQDLSLFIETSVCSALPFTFTANIVPPAAGLPGQGPYTVSWYWNTSGNFNTAIGGFGISLGTGQVLSVSPHPNCRKYWVKCKVVAADGTTVTRFKKIDLTPIYCSCEVEPGPGGGPKERLIAPSVANDSSALYFYPNPVRNGLINLESKNFANTTVQTVAFDLSGRAVSYLPAVFDANGQAQLLLKYLPDGLYTLQLSEINGRLHHVKFANLQN